ncbi:DNA-binding transcriptional ArsR family regulator [Saccharothrix saharensis]|uniref:DNA-binding transcriptional ArsR family regulator n=1 Tax=Saccharothrix saharensis TaxID=571190 RepID=A0A543J965_9PSEU|nr:metalloregulator ArsR/SmtB family transcription factor [Saccharothrix saharensis]TQM79380.1 DNA-binding transcriptional ArsR family regulator [Saccharothrix saharensis]
MVKLASVYSGPAFLDPADAQAAATLFKALADPVRIQVVAMVRRAEGGEITFNDLADEFDMPQSSLSHHLNILVKAGVLKRERRGTWSHYKVETGPWAFIEHLLRTGGPLAVAPSRRRRSHPPDCP